MTAAVLLTRHSAEGIRRTDPKRDLAAVGELLGLAFGSELDASGRRMVREMKRYGQYGWVGWLLAQLMIPTATFPRGYVWFEDGRLVGNAHLLRVAGYPQRWVVANVAVHPDYQRRGIATELMNACIQDIRSRSGQEIMLQVRTSNPGARSLYENLGFNVESTRTDWVLSRDVVPEQQRVSFVRSRKSGEWQQQAAIAKAQYPEGLIWPMPSIEEFYRPARLGDLLGFEYRSHWVYVDQGRITGSLSLLSRPESSIHLVLAAAGGYHGTVEEPLLSFGLQQIGRINRQVQLSYASGIVDSIIEKQGFLPKNTLHWMRLDLRQAQQ